MTIEQTYKYTSINDGQIRVLVLDPGTPEDPLAGDLEAAELSELSAAANALASGDLSVLSLEDGKVKTFEALSYVWHSGEPADIITTPRGTLPITASLSSSLHRLRLPDSRRVLWADAICINQANLNEKSYQVGLMGDIYPAATQVVCDLGEAYDDSDAALDLMERYWQKWLRTGFDMSEYNGFTGQDSADLLDLPLLSEEEAAAIEDIPPNKDPSLDCVRRFHKRPWFGRLWVVQEFILARDVVFLCGARRVPWQRLLAAYLPYKGRAWPFYDAGEALESLVNNFMGIIIMGLMRWDRTLPRGSPRRARFDDFLQYFSNGQMTKLGKLPFVLISFTWSKTTIDRDRYFAVLALADDAKEAGLYPDYESPIEDIIMQYGRYVMERSDVPGEMILCAGVPGRERDHPSWIRDYTAGNIWDHLWLMGPLSTISYTAAGKTKWWHKLDDDDPDLMHTVGCRLDTIARIGANPERGKPLTVASIVPHLQNQLRFYTSHLRERALCPEAGDLRYAATGEPLLAALWQTVTAAITTEWSAEMMSRLGTGFDMAQLIDFNGGTGPGMAELFVAMGRQRGETDTAKLANMFSEFCGQILRSWGLSYAVTEGGLLGVVETASREGDEVWVLRGVRVPVVMRPSEERPGMYEMVAGCYMHGIMQGEALERPEFKWRGLTIC